MPDSVPVSPAGEPSRSGSRRTVAAVAAAVLLTLAGAEVCARLILPVVPPSGSVPRIPFRYRGWPEYVAGVPSQPTNGQCVLISNCQGYGGEYDGRMIYSVELGRRLAERRVGGWDRWTVHNWSVDGATSIDFVFAAATLTPRRPDVVLALTGYADYLAVHGHASFAYSRTDLPRLLNRPSVRRALPVTFLDRHGRTEQNLTFRAADTLALLRLSDYAWSWAERRVPGLLTSFYAPNMPYIPWQIPKVRKTWLPGLTGGARDNFDSIPLDYTAVSTVMLSEYLDVLSRLRGRVVFVAQPYLHRDHPSERVFLRDAERLCAERGLEFWDLTAAVPDDEFKTSAHLSRKGHLRLAGLLAGRLALPPGSPVPAADTPSATPPAAAATPAGT
jgi:hypothetical protein